MTDWAWFDSIFSPVPTSINSKDIIVVIGKVLLYRVCMTYSVPTWLEKRRAFDVQRYFFTNKLQLNGRDLYQAEQRKGLNGNFSSWAFKTPDTKISIIRSAVLFVKRDLLVYWDIIYLLPNDGQYHTLSTNNLDRFTMIWCWLMAESVWNVNFLQSPCTIFHYYNTFCGHNIESTRLAKYQLLTCGQTAEIAKTIWWHTGLKIESPPGSCDVCRILSLEDWNKFTLQETIPCPHGRETFDVQILPDNDNRDGPAQKRENRELTTLTFFVPKASNTASLWKKRRKRYIFRAGRMSKIMVESQIGCAMPSSV